MGDACLYTLHDISLYLGEFPKRSWHILFASLELPFTKGLTAEPEGYKKVFQKALVGQRQR